MLEQAAPPPDTPTAAAQTPAPADTPRYVRVEAAGAGLEVHPGPADSLIVLNRDPALTGQLRTVRAFAADGTPTTVTVRVPPPSP